MTLRGVGLGFLPGVADAGGPVRTFRDDQDVEDVEVEDRGCDSQLIPDGSVRNGRHRVRAGLETVDHQGIGAHAQGFLEDLPQIDGSEIDRALDQNAIHQDAIVGIDGNEADARTLVLFAADPDPPDGVVN